MRVYCGRRNAETGQVTELFVRETETGRQYEIIERPYPGTTGLEWGYAGTGPHNTARAILDDLLGRIPDWVGDFEREVVANLEPEFDLADETIYARMDAQGYR